MQWYVGANAVPLTWLSVAVALSLVLAVVATMSPPPVGWWPLWVLSVLSLLTVLPRADLVYLTMALWPLPLLALALDGRSYGRLRLTVGTMLVAVAITCTLALGTLVVHVSSWTALYQPAPGDPLAVGANWWEVVGGMVRQRTNPGEPVFATPYLPWVYFVAQRPNATRFSYLVQAFHPSEFFDSAIADLERLRPRVVVRQLGSFAVKRGFHQDGGVVDQYLDRHYRIVDVLSERRIQILERYEAGVD